MTREQIWLLIWGLGIFLFGTMAFEEAIGFLITKNLKNLLKTTTDKLYKAIGVWAFVTAILQSSSVVSLITLAFVGAGVIALPNALGVILGANIGAPLTDIVLWNLGLKFSLSAFALPIIWIAGVLMLIFSRYTKFRHVCKLFVWLGLIFLGLGYMKDSMMAISAWVNFSQYIWYTSLVYFLIGLIVTIIMQSSSATVVLVLTAASSGIVDYRMGAALIMGAFLGTTITAVLGAIWPFPLKKQTAFGHVFFNLFSIILWLIFLPWIVFLLDKMFSDVVFGLSVFAIWFKIIWVLLISPFIWYFTRFLQWLFPVKETLLWLSLEQVDPTVPEAAIIAMRKDTVKLLKRSFVYILHVRSVDEKILLKSSSGVQTVVDREKNFDETTLEQEYAQIKMIEASIIAFGAQIKRHTTKLPEVQTIEELYRVVSTTVASAKYIKDIAHNVASMEESISPWLSKQYITFRSMIISLFKVISEVIDGKHSNEILTKILVLVQDIKQVDNLFLQSLTKELTKEKMKKFDLSDILHINRYVYLSSLSFVDSIKQMFLTEEEKKVFDELR